MSDAERINKLIYALGIAIGALEAIELRTYDGSAENIKHVIKRLKALVEYPTIIVSSEGEIPNE